MIAGTYQDKWHKVPLSVRRFILRAAIVLVVWKLLYLLFLLPARTLDRPLSHAVAHGATAMLNRITGTRDYWALSERGNVITDDGPTNMPLDDIYFRGKNIVSVEDGCNGLELFVLYTGFILCMPATWRRKLYFTLGGIVLIYIVNIIRCAGIAYMTIYYPKQAGFAHHYVFTFIVYGIIIGLWILFARNAQPSTQTKS
jgi:exosortase family protein XrtF